jgi:toxin-antitoxin system PIN domain toxin
MNSTYLLDANVLIALAVAEHEAHERAEAWVASVAMIALCPIVEGALIRYLVRIGEAAVTAAAFLSGLYRSPKCEFWPDSVSVISISLDHVTGHRQVTDAYLAGLARSHQGRLATFDRPLALALPDVVELLPDS